MRVVARLQKSVLRNVERKPKKHTNLQTQIWSQKSVKNAPTFLANSSISSVDLIDAWGAFLMLQNGEQTSPL
jgi:hypothetical protein